MEKRFRIWLKWLPIRIKMYRLNFWVWKNQTVNKILGIRCNQVTAVTGEWEAVDEGVGELLYYRPVRIVNGRKRWPFRRAYRTGFQIVDAESIPLIAKDIDEIVATRARIRALNEKHMHRRMQKEAFGLK